MRYLTYISSFLILFVIVYSCVNNHKTVAVLDNKESMENLAANIAGTYVGNLPCVDCESIATQLELHQDNTYILRYTYEGKSDDQFVKEGDWSISKNKLNLKGVDYQYKVDADILSQLDLSGNEIKGDLAESYRLSRVK